MNMPEKIGQNCVISEKVKFGANVCLGHSVIIEDDVCIGDNVYIEDNSIIRNGVRIGEFSHIGAFCVLGEHLMDWYQGHSSSEHPLVVGAHALNRSHTTIYGDTVIGDFFQTGHFVSIREKTMLGEHVSVGTLCNVQGDCRIGDYVRMHSNVQIGQKSVIENYVWIFPNVVLTNDPNPPSNDLLGVHICSYAIVATGAIILPGKTINEDSLVAAGAIVGNDVAQFAVVSGNPAKKVADVRYIRNMETGEKVYPWKYHFSRAMPWEDQGYDQWYASLDFNSEKNSFTKGDK